MGKSVEYRIPMPLSLDEYHIALTYMKSRMQMENTGGSEGVQVVASKPFSNEELGSGHFTHVVYHMQSKAPSWLRALAPSGALQLEEMSWNAFPHSKTVLKCPYFTKFQVTITSVYVEDKGTSENALKLSEEALKARTVELIDISVTEKTLFTRMIAKSGIDPTKYRSAKLSRGPLAPGWVEKSEPIMTAYKLVTVDAPYWGWGRRLENLVLSGERALFLEAHKKCYGWMDEWCEMTLDDVRRVERDNIESMRKSLSLGHSRVAPEQFDESSIGNLNLGEDGADGADGGHQIVDGGDEPEKVARGQALAAKTG